MHVYIGAMQQTNRWYGSRLWHRGGRLIMFSRTAARTRHQVEDQVEEVD